MTSISMTSSRNLRLLLVGCSSLALTMPLAANDVIFPASAPDVQVGQRTTQGSGVTQIKLTNGGVVSITQGAQYTINADGSIDLHKGSITVTGAARSPVTVRMPGGVDGRIVGTSSSAGFSVDDDGTVSGHTLTGVVRVGVDGKNRRPYREGQMWSAKSGEKPKRAFANSAVEQPSGPSNSDPVSDDVLAIGGDAGPVNAALNGIPVTLGDGLAAAGASSDIIAAGRRVEAAVANPTIDRFPSGDLALLVASAADLERVYGGVPFNAAQADIIRTYLAFLASGASGAEFLTAYSSFTLGYLDLIRAGGVPSGFASGAASAADVDAYLAFIARTGAISSLSAQDRSLADAYLAFLASGQNRDLFASSFTDLTAAYFAFLRSGGVPAQFTGASQQALSQSIAFLQQSGLLVQLSAADQALVTAFLANGGIDFTGQFQTALAQYFAFLASGQVPSDYTVLDQATLRSYLETLSDTGLLTTLLGDQAQFYADYLAFLRAGGNVDAFAGLPANIFAGYRTDLDAYFAFLENGGIPSAYTPLSQAVIAQYLAALEEAGATQFFLGDLAQFYQDYFAFLSGGGNPDNFAGLPVPPDFPAFAAALNAYAAFLSANGLPSDFSETDLAALQEFFNAVQQSGQLDTLLGANADLLSAYFAFLDNGGAADGFASLPIYLDYVTALNAYFDFLAAGNLPSEYTVLDAATIELYLAALAGLQGGLGGFADLNPFFVDYFNFVQGGNNPNDFGSLPNDLKTNFANNYRGVLQPGVSSFGPSRAATVTTDGQITTTTSSSGVVTDHAATAGTLREHGRFGNDVAFTRYENPVANGQATNQNTHLLVGDFATNLPTTGTVEYALVGGTLPTDVFVEQGTTGSFSGRMAVAFKTLPEVGLDFDVYFGGRGWNTRTAGGADNPDDQGLVIDGSGRFEFISGPELITTALIDGSCAVSCSTRVFGSLFGDGAPFAGFAYQISAIADGTTDARFSNVSGLAVFGQNDTALTSLGTLPGGGGAGVSEITLEDVYALSTFPIDSDRERLASATIDPNGVITALTNQRGGGAFLSGAYGAGFNSSVPFEVKEVGGVEEVMAWNSYFVPDIQTSLNVGTTNFTGHLMVGVEAFNLPSMGQVTYNLIGGTAPTNTSLPARTSGFFEGMLAVAFSSNPTVGFEFDIWSEGDGVRFATNGGVQDASQSGLGISTFFGNTFNTGDGARGTGAIEGVALAGDVCSDAACFLSVQGGLYGEGASHVGIVYQAFGGVDGSYRLRGSAAFAANSTAIDGVGDASAKDAGGGNTGGNTDASGGTGFTGTRSNQVYYTFLDGSLASAFGGTADFVNGEVTSVTSVIGTVSSNDAQIVEATDLEQIAWARWTNGTVQSTGLTGDIDSVIGANGGYHVMTGEVTTSLPGGTIAYELIGGTSATDNAGSAPGSVTGDLAIAFGSVNRVGYDLTMALGGRSWAVSTTGGAANPGTSEVNLVAGSGGFTFGGAFTNSAGTVTSTGDTCAPSCFVNVSGTLYGDNAAYAALAMNVTDTNSTGLVAASGLAIFGQEGASSSIVQPSQSTAQIAASRAAVSPATDWSRWSVPVETGSGEAASMLALPGSLTPTSAGQPGTLPSDRARAISQAQQMMGGIISWDNSSSKR